MSGAPDIFAAALATIFAELGAPALLDGAAITGDLVDAYVNAGGVESTAPAFEVTDAVAALATRTSVLIIGATTYKVIGNQPTGQGTTHLILSED
jgi:hypothetical protein